MLNLDNILEQIQASIDAGTMKITGVNEQGDKILIVLRGDWKSLDKSVTVIDDTVSVGIVDPEPIEPCTRTAVQEQKAKEEAKSRETLDGRVILKKEEGEVVEVACKFCGKACSPRGATRNENSCKRQPF